MTYALDPRLFLEHGPAAQAASLAKARPAARRLRWRRLDPELRFDAVQQALKSPANDCIDSYPLAL